MRRFIEAQTAEQVLNSDGYKVRQLLLDLIADESSISLSSESIRSLARFVDLQIDVYRLNERGRHWLERVRSMVASTRNGHLTDDGLDDVHRLFVNDT